MWSHKRLCYGGFYFVRVVELNNEVVFAKRYVFGLTFGTGRGVKQVTPKVYRLAFLCLPWSPAMYRNRHINSLSAAEEAGLRQGRRTKHGRRGAHPHPDRAGTRQGIIHVRGFTIVSTTYVSKQHKHNSYCVFEACGCLSASSEHLKRRLLKWLLDHPVHHVARCVVAQGMEVRSRTSEPGRLPGDSWKSLSLSLYIYIYIHTHTNKQFNKWINTHIHIHICIYVYIYIYIYV